MNKFIFFLFFAILVSCSHSPKRFVAGDEIPTHNNLIELLEYNKQIVNNWEKTIEFNGNPFIVLIQFFQKVYTKESFFLKQLSKNDDWPKSLNAIKSLKRIYNAFSLINALSISIRNDKTLMDGVPKEQEYSQSFEALNAMFSQLILPKGHGKGLAGYGSFSDPDFQKEAYLLLLVDTMGLVDSYYPRDRGYIKNLINEIQKDLTNIYLKFKLEGRSKSLQKSLLSFNQKYASKVQYLDKNKDRLQKIYDIILEENTGIEGVDEALLEVNYLKTGLFMFQKIVKGKLLI